MRAILPGGERFPAVGLVFAGGSGTRMCQKDGIPKQFIEVDGTPILIHTLRRFQECSSIDLIYVVVPSGWVDYMIELVISFSISKVALVVPGGGTALESIFHGLKQMVNDGIPGESIVAIHDGVRPIINRELIMNNVQIAQDKGNAITSIPAFETVALKKGRDDLVKKVVNRKKAFVLQAPQTYHLSDVYETNLRAQQDNVMQNFVDQANMQYHYGKPQHLIEGFRGNIKITIPDDVRYFTYLVETGEYEKIIAAHSLRDVLQ